MSDTIRVVTTCDLAKSVNEEERLFTAVVLRPNVVDAHGDIYDEDVVKQACHDFVAYCMNSNLQHMMDVTKADLAFVESYIAPCDITEMYGKPVDVRKGDWVMTAKIGDDDIWKACKSGTFTGFSVGCSSLVEILEPEVD